LDKGAQKVSLGLDPNRLAIGFLGKISRSKQVDKIVAAFELVRNAGVDAQLVIAGNGPDAAMVEARIASSAYAGSVSRISRVGPGEEAAVFQALDLYVSYSQAGLGVLEALAYGVPIVATPERYPETELLIDDFTAFIASEKSPHAFAEALIRAASSQGKLTEVAANGRKVVLEKANLDRMVDAMCDAVEYALTICARRRGALE
jgi:glycosyltransferase involved in cell wall biosynthesis